MDETVKKAMQKWPNVPNVFGWLRLDRRGNWLLQVAPQRFERIGNAGLIEFIGRNYERDEQGRWYFQNGPQRVFVGLDYAPYVYRLGEDRRQWVTQAGEPAGRPLELLVDEEDCIVLVTELGPGLVADRDLPALVDGLADEHGAEIDMQALVARLRQAGDRAQTGLRLFGVPLSLAPMQRAALAPRFGFVAEPGQAIASETSTPIQ